MSVNEPIESLILVRRILIRLSFYSGVSDTRYGETLGFVHRDGVLLTASTFFFSYFLNLLHILRELASSLVAVMVLSHIDWSEIYPLFFHLAILSVSFKLSLTVLKLHLSCICSKALFKNRIVFMRGLLSSVMGARN